MGRLYFILGGVRSGKSRFAMELAGRLGRRVLFVATASPKDEEMHRRIEEHRRSRPPFWKTLEVVYNIAAELEREKGYEVILIDCLSILVANILERATPANAWNSAEAEVRGILDYRERTGTELIIVSNEVGLGIVPPYPLGRLYRDILGRCNQTVAAAADEVHFLIAGLPLKLK